MENCKTPQMVDNMIYTLLEPEHPILLTKLPEITAETEPEDRK